MTPRVRARHREALTGRNHRQLFRFQTLVEVFGRDINYWERVWLSLRRNSLLGTTVKAPGRLPAQLVADEKVTWLKGAEENVDAFIVHPGRSRRHEI